MQVMEGRRRQSRRRRPSFLVTKTKPSMIAAIKQERNDRQSVDRNVNSVMSEFLVDGHFLYRDQLGGQVLAEVDENSESSAAPSSSGSGPFLNQEMPDDENWCEHRQCAEEAKEELRLATLFNKNLSEENQKMKEESQKIKEENQMLKVRVTKLEQDKYSLGIIADYEIGKAKKKLNVERRKRVQAEQNLKAIIRQSGQLNSKTGIKSRRVQQGVDGKDDNDDIQCLGIIEK